MSTSRPPTPSRAGPGVRRAYLVTLAGPHFGEVFPLDPGREIVIGRDAGCDVIVQDAGVSRRHAAIRVDDRGASIRDLASRNGTFVDGAGVAEARLGDGARIQLGAATTLRFSMSDSTDAEFQRRLADAALRDPLTGLHNRATFAERLAAELDGYRSRPRPVAVLACDIDHFKRVNDAHGHAAGDAVLKTVAAALRGGVRPEDVVVRWGGEEFMLLLRDAAEARALAVAERVRSAVAAAGTPWQGATLRVTLSVGVAVLSPPPELDPGAAERVLLDRADRALYRAKAQGRDRVELADGG